MKNKNLKDKLRQSIAEENDTVNKRFSFADNLFDKKPIATKKEKIISKSYTITESEAQEIEELLLEFAQNGILATRSEVIRLGLLSLKKLASKKLDLIKELRSA